MSQRSRIRSRRSLRNALRSGLRRPAPHRGGRTKTSWSATTLEPRLLLAGDATAAPVAAVEAVTEIPADQSQSAAVEIAFVDPSVNNIDQLTALSRDGVEIVLIDNTSPALKQMTDVLTMHRNVSAVHVVSHGDAGKIAFGDQTIDHQDLLSNRHLLSQWRAALGDQADVLIYGCDTARGSEGANFLDTIASLTGADVAGSINRTGSDANFGDWVLERTTGVIDASLLASHGDLNAMDVVLPINIRAAGSTGEEEMLLQIDGVTVATFNNIGGNAGAGQYETYTYNNASPVSANQVRVVFTNDVYEPAQGIDRNLRIDNIEIDGVVFETEDPSVFGTGTWRPSDGIQPGFRESEWLHADGYFQYADTSTRTGSDITIYAAGNENAESMELWIDGVSVAAWTNIGGNASSGQFAAYQFTADETVTADQIQVHFTNDRWDPSQGIDNNLRVDRIVIDGTSYQTEAPNVYSTGTWKEGEITPGFKEDETLHTNGYFQYGSSLDAGVIALATSTVTVNESDGQATIDVVRTGGSIGQVTVDYDTELGTATAGSDYTSVAGTLTFAEGETVKTIVIPILDDSAAESIEQFGVTIDNVNGGAVLLVPRTATVTIVDDEVSLPEFNDFSSVAGLNLNGDAVRDGDELRLTPTSDNRAGSAFFDTAISLDNNASFRSSFAFRVSGGSGGADGLTFTIQNDTAGANAIGSTGGGLGYEGITNSVAVEFDNYKNPYDVNGNHVAILQGGSVSSSLKTLEPSFNLNNGSTYYAWVEYNGTSDVLAVYLNNSNSKPATALLKATVDLESAVGNSAYFGFTAATGGANNAHRILSWQMDQQIPPQDPPTEQGDTVVAIDVIANQGLALPTAIEWLPDGTMLIAEKGGVVKTAKDGVVSSTPFIDISNIVNGVRDRGLLDIAVHPDFENNPYVYLLFTYDPPEVFNQQAGTLAGPDGKGNRAGRMIRVTADASNGYLTAVAGSDVVLLGSNSTWDNFNGFANSTQDFNEPPAGENADGTQLRDFINSDSESHTVGGLAFAPDGSLYVSIGDGASYNDVDVRADRVQDIDNLSGKILRIDPITGQGLSDNPFYNGDPDANRSKVYQLGLRNPFRISVDPVTGQLFIGDVGWTRWEEINSGGPGANFGWPFYEGGSGTSNVLSSYANTPEGQAFFNLDPPVDAAIYALNHQADGINAIVMGDAYRGSLYGAEYEGDIFFNDLGQGIVRHASIDANGNVTDVKTFTTGANVVVAISQGPDGALYYVDLDDSKIGRWEVV